MTVPLDLITQRNLILVKQIYQRAVVQSASHHSDVDRILSLISFDLANETLLKNAIRAVDSQVDIVSKLRVLIKTANEVFAKASPPIPTVPGSQNILRVRDIRNGAMHEAKYPTATDINDCRTYTRDFLQQLVMNVWGLDFIAIKLTDAIQNDEIKQLLIKAEKHLDASESTNAVAHVKMAMQLALGRTQAVLASKFPNDVDAIVVGKSEQVGPSKKMYEAIQEMLETLTISVIGLDYSSHRKYERITGHFLVGYYGGGKFDFANTWKEPSADDAEFAVNYAVNTVLQIESLVGIAEYQTS